MIIRVPYCLFSDSSREPEVHGVADHGVAHDRVRPDVAGDHRPGVDADADVELGPPLAPPLRVQLAERRRSSRAPPRPRGRRARGSSSGAPNSAITMSPTNLSSVPLCANTMSTMRVKYSFSMPTISSGCAALGHGREAADVGEEHRHLAALAAEPRQRRVRHQLVVDVLRDVLAEQLLHLPLLAPFDEVLVARRRRTARATRRAPAATGSASSRRRTAASPTHEQAATKTRRRRRRPPRRAAASPTRPIGERRGERPSRRGRRRPPRG